MSERIVEVMARALCLLHHKTDNLAKYFDADARNVLAALDAAGFAIVPKEPTEAMLKAAIDAAPSELMDNGWRRVRASWSTDECREVYRAMLLEEPGQLVCEQSHFVGYWDRLEQWQKDYYAGIELAIRASALEEAAKACEGDFDSEMRGYGNYFAAVIRALIPSPAQEPRE
jgi:hypothetical protein